MRLLERLGKFALNLRHRRRRVYRVADHEARRTHIELRRVPAPLREAYHLRVRADLEAMNGVRWARVNAPLGRVVVAHDHGLASDALVAALDEVDLALGLEGEALGDLDVEHPADDEPITRALIERRVDAGGVVAGIGLSLSPLKRLPFEFDVAAALTALDAVPGARRWLADTVGESVADLGLAVGSATASVMLKGPAGPLVDGLRRTLRLKELEERRRLFVSLEPTLSRHPSQHEVPAEDPGPRPRELPSGPIERYVDKAVFATAGGFGLGVASTGSVAAATATVFGGLPRPAQLGREAFAAQLGRALSRRSILVMQTGALRRLDRIDRLVLTSDLVTLEPGRRRLAKELVTLLAAARRADVGVVLATGGPTDAPVFRGIGTVEVIEAADSPATLLAVRRLQREGHGVMVVSGAAGPALAAGDVRVGLFGGEGPPPWGADIIGLAGLGDAQLLLGAIPAARAASTQSVQIAMVEAATGFVLSLAGLQKSTAGKVMAASHAASLLAMGNAVRLGEAAGMAALPPARDRTAWHALGKKDVLRRLDSTKEGLSSAAADARESGAPTTESDATIFARLALDELANPLTPVLAAGAGLSALTGSILDAGIISSVLGFNVLVGATQRLMTERALASLDRVEQRNARVVRDGTLRDVNFDELVRGDVVRLHAGEVVPADCRILVAHDLEADESSLTGESQAVPKSAAKSRAEAIADRRSMLWEGTTVAAGRAVAVITAIGPATEAQRAALEAGAAPTSGVERRLQGLTELSAPVAALSGLAIMGAGLARKRPAADVISSGVALAVAAVPEGLPLLASLSQLGAAQRLADEGAIVRNPRAIEALGRVDVVCADKTGTLTEGRIALTRVSDGAIEAPLSALEDRHRSVLAAALRASPEPRANKRAPHATDRALLEGYRAGGDTVDVTLGAPGFERIAELPFEPGRGYHAVRSSTKGKGLLSVKGAPETVLARCNGWRGPDGKKKRMSRAARERLVAHERGMAERGLRVLAVAERVVKRGGEDLEDDDVTGLTFVGFVGFADPPRASAKGAVAQLRAAGVRVVMVTGDHPGTAQAIATELGIGDDGCVISGAELAELSEDELDRRLDDVSVFARVTPVQKVRIVRAFQRNGHAVAMTGDGANDAPAIRLADVGIAFGNRSTAAARRAADMVVADEGIETIVTALLEGRALWKSVRDAVGLLVGGNLGEIGFMVIGSLLSGSSPLNARQLLLVNLLTDTAPALAVAMRPSSTQDPEALLAEGPEASLGKQLERDIALRAAITTACTSAAWGFGRMTGTGHRANTVALLTLIGSQMAQTLVVGGRNKPVMLASLGATAALVGLVQTPVLSHFFGCRPLGPLGLLVASAGTAAAAAATVAAPKVVARVWPNAPVSDQPENASSKASAKS